MVKPDIVNCLVGQLSLPRPTTTEAVNTVLEILEEGLSAGERNELRGTGVLA